jgi:anti-anti-sigma factor
MSGLAITKERLKDGIIVVTLKGFLDAYTFEQFENTLNDLFANNTYRIILDLTNLDYISSAGAGVLISAIGTAQENNGNIVIVKPTPSVKEVLDLLGLSHIFVIAQDRNSAQMAFKRA